MSDCPKCKNVDCIKDGIVRDRQRYQCKTSGYRHTVAYKWYSEELKQQALKMYLEDLGFRSIAQHLNCSHVAVYQAMDQTVWIKKPVLNLRQLRLPWSRWTRDIAKLNFQII